MTRPRLFIAILALLAMVPAAWVFWSGDAAPAAKLAVVFVGITNNPTRQMTPTRIEMGQGATGRCALFLVTNTSPKTALWFKTDSVERKTEAGWKPFFVSPSGPWSGISGSLWQPRYGCLYAVGWPPGLPAGATWRLQLNYGRDVSLFGMVINQKTGWNLFHSGKKESTISSTEVNQ